MSSLYSQLNLYSILDAIGLDATVGDKSIVMKGIIPIDTGEFKFDLKVSNLRNGITENDESMCVILKAESVGLMFIATKGVLFNIIVINLNDQRVKASLKEGDIGLLVKRVNSNKLGNAVLEIINC